MIELKDLEAFAHGHDAEMPFGPVTLGPIEVTGTPDRFSATFLITQALTLTDVELRHKLTDERERSKLATQPCMINGDTFVCSWNSKPPRRRWRRKQKANDWGAIKLPDFVLT